jgi:serine/threonine protein phosphatase 1
MDGRLIAIGDIHGCFDSFRELVEKRIRLLRADRLVLLGDYIDRGSDIKEVIDYILELQSEGYDIIPLRGNHESMLLDTLENERNMTGWSMNGGLDTLQSFRVESVGDLNPEYLMFFSTLRFYYCEDNFIFVHAGFDDRLENPFEDKVQMLWSRREAYSNPFFNGKIIIHGHTPVSLEVCRENVKSGNRVINIDTGCVYKAWEGYGYLTAIEIKTRELFSV